MAILLQNRHAEAVERVDVPGVAVPDQRADALPHLARRLIGEGDAENVSGQDAELIYKIGKAAGERAGLARAGARNHTDKALGRRDRLALRRVQSVQQILHEMHLPFVPV